MTGIRLLAAAIALLMWGGMYGQEALSDSLTAEEPSVLVSEIPEGEDSMVPEELPDSVYVEYSYPDYLPWERVQLQGKLRMQGLPLSPTLRFYMERDSLIDISVRAPFIGEAMRIEIRGDSIMAANKMNKQVAHVRIPLAEGGINPGRVIGMIQELLLGRFFLPGIPLEGADLDDLVEVVYEDNQLNVVPKGEAVIEGLDYGFVVDENFDPLMLVVIPTGRRDIEIAAIYERQLKGYQIKLVVALGSDVKEASLEMKEPDWDAEAPKALDVSKYKEVGIEELVKNIGR